MENLINEFFASHPDAKFVCLTSDNSLFNELHFANAHSFRLEDQQVKIFGVNNEFKEANERLFFDGSKYEFYLIAENNKAKETKYDSLSVAELKDLAEELEGYNSKLKKSDLIELLTKNEL